MTDEEFIVKGSEIEKELLEIFGREDNIIIADIGACEGLSSVIYFKLFPNSTIHAFEPMAENCGKITLNFLEHGISGQVHCCALGGSKGNATFHSSYGKPPGSNIESGWNKSGSLLSPKEHLREHPWCKFKKRKVTVDTLDNIGIPHVDFVHMDVQGAEMLVLQNGKKTLKDTKAFWIEVANIELYKDQVLKGDLQRYMDRNGFKCIKDTCGNKMYGDMLFVRK